MVDASVHEPQAVPPRLAQLFEVVLDAAERKGQLDTRERQLFFETGSAAADAGLPLSHLVDAYLRGAGELWEHLFAHAPVAGIHAVELSRTMRQISETAVASLADGFENARRLNIAAEENVRRELIDALLGGDSIDPVWFERRTEELGFPRASSYVVAVAEGRRVVASDPIHALVERQLRNRYPLRAWISTVRKGQLVVIAGDSDPSELEVVEKVLGAETPASWHVGIGDICHHHDGIAASYEQAAEALRLAVTFDLDPTVHHSRLLIYRLLAANRDLTTAMFDQIITPLVDRRDRALLDTLEAYIDANGNMARVARDLSIGPRTVAYRLDRIAQLTGYSPRDPDGRLTLELAIRSRPLDPANREQG